MNLEGLIPLAGGVYGFRMAAWRKKFGGILKVLCPLLVLFGALQLFGVLR